MSNILNHNRSIFDVRVSKSDYWDHHLYLYNGGGDNVGLQDECLISYIDTDDDECVLSENEMASKNGYVWGNSVNNGVELNNIGLTGADNGLITFDKDDITQEEFDELYTKSSLKIDADDMRLHVNKVGGNNKIYSYPNTFVVEDDMNVARLNGGFFQGFFKIDGGCDYQVLPSKVGDGWTMEFVLKPEHFESNYSVKKEKYSVLDYNSDGWDGDMGKDDEYSDEYFSDDYSDDNPLPTLNDVYPENKGLFFYIGTRSENKWWKYYTNNGSSDTTTADGISLNDKVKTILTDNKFITYSRTRCGLMASMKDMRDAYQQITIDEPFNTENYFIIMHRGKCGYTARTIKELKQESGSEYNILSDLYRNAFALQIMEDGSVGYKYMVKDCSTEEGYSILSEFSYPDMVAFDEWSTISVRIIPSGDSQASNNSTELNMMRLMVYVNGRLVLCSKEIPMLDLRLLNDIYSKQEAVPYNISLGGGTQGLCDVVYEDYKQIPEYVLYLEKEFGGGFNGYFRSFRFFNCSLDYSKINANVKFDNKINE